MAIVVTDKGHVENKTINLEKSVEAREVSKTSELLNKMLKGTPINDVSAKLEFEIKPIIGNYVKNYEVLYNAFYEALSNFQSEKMFIGKEKQYIKTTGIQYSWWY